MSRFTDVDVSSKRLPAVYGYHSQKLVSLEQALELIVPQIDQLARYIKTAKKYCLYPSEHNLTRDESASIYIYTMEWDESSLYRVLNKALRDENRQGLKIWFPYLKLFDTALDKLPTVKEGLWRGVSLDIGKNFRKNQILTWWTVNSCSSSVDVINRFLGESQTSTLFMIEAANGKKVSGYTVYEDEDEVILPIGTQFRVKSNPLKQSNDSHIVHMIEINDDDDQDVASEMDQMHLNANSAKSKTTTTVLSKPPTYRNQELEQMIDEMKDESTVDFRSMHQFQFQPIPIPVLESELVGIGRIGIGVG
ncbi:unnamed protein product [Adineta steineri]|uniref:NAD(P)(+)--arginine ADP-ribosyltransferase n=1 Tax=Adineta steineri TaxID=433720 RepID=A0A814GXA7_9BILA|nr:unnamed protein product [Adineta steineri]CAF1271990.1 unnamed protein product [Adineta steineri]